MNQGLSENPEVRAIVGGKELTQLPDDLFIPPEALEVLLDTFSGPLDLLLYLIRKQNIDILNIPMVTVTEQYLHYIHMMGNRRLDLAADYLLMAATLIEIKSRLLFPVTFDSEQEEEDPRMALVRRLQAYEQIKYAAEQLDKLPRIDRDHFIIQIEPEHIEIPKIYPNVELYDLITAMQSILEDEEKLTHHQIVREIISVRERMSIILQQLEEHKILEFTQLFSINEGRLGLIVSFLAILELAKQSLLIITQMQAFSPIYLQAA
jgi:segregation and condensation protein A